MAENPKVGLIKKTETNTIFIPVQYDDEAMTITAEGIEFTSGDIFTIVVDDIDKPQINHKSQKVCLESTISRIRHTRRRQFVVSEKELQDQRLTHP